MKHSDLERLKKITSVWDALKRQLEERGVTKEQLLNDEYTQWAVTTPLFNIGEQVYRLDGEYKRDHPEIPWSLVAGLRHRLVHDYEGVNWSIIVEVVFGEMDSFVSSLKSILAEESEI